MTAEQVFRCAILKQYRNLTYEELAFHREDSLSFQAFARLRMGHKPSGSTLQENIKALSEAAWEAANRKEKGISDVCFSKLRGIPVPDMVKSSWVYKKLRNFRAGIEANISVLKRAFGLTRCTWSGWIQTTCV